MSNNRSGVSKFGDSEHSFILSKKLRFNTAYYFKRDNVTTRFHLFWATSYVGAILRRDILRLTFGCCSKNSATFKAFSVPV
jgi:hypothetical protein